MVKLVTPGKAGNAVGTDEDDQNVGISLSHEDDAVLIEVHYTDDEYDDEDGAQGDSVTVSNAEDKMPRPIAAAGTPKSTAGAYQRVLCGGDLLQRRDAGLFQADIERVNDSGCSTTASTTAASFIDNGSNYRSLTIRTSTDDNTIFHVLDADDDGTR